MKVLVTGGSGQLGYDVVKEGKLQAYDISGISSKELDITNEQAVKTFINNVRPNVIIHCAAYTSVDGAEDDNQKCYDVNVNGTRYLAQAAKVVDAKFIYISTDYVFDGKGESPFTEIDNTNPCCYYGQTKLSGEQLVQQLLSNYFIVRISWVFGINGNNFVKTMLKLAETRDEVSVVSDQFGSPTYTVDIAKLIIEMVKTNKYGVYHASNEGFCSWAEFAEEIFKLSKKTIRLNSIATSEYPTKATRPLNSRMSKAKLKEAGLEELPSWQNALKRYLKELNCEICQN